ncbi:MAG: cysteine synthase family protein [Acidobacteria bacterium]|nr:cysteine synthase family protein [Acidobacteriota bacterium]
MEDRRYRPFLERFPALRLIGGTPMVRVSVPGESVGDAEIHAKAEWMNPGGSIKDRPILRMLLEARLSGELTPDRTILDSTSGNAGIAYAMIGAILGQKVELVMPGNASEERKKRIQAHGAEIILTDPVEGYDEAIREAHRRREADPERYYMPDQYRNENNWKAHFETTAGEILDQVDGELTHFVAGVGTGGTLTGVGRRLKEHSPEIRILQVVPESFPGIEGLKPMEDPGDLVPEIFDPSVVDEKISVTVEEAFRMCRLLASQGLFVGQSSGAYLAGALRIARRHRSGKIVTVFSDLGERYFSTGLWDP